MAGTRPGPPKLELMAIRSRSPVPVPLFALVACLASLFGRVEFAYAQAASWETAMKSAQSALAEDNAARAETFLKQAVQLAEQGEVGQQDLALSLTLLASLYHSQNRYAEAEPLLLRALPLTERILGPEHPDVARILGNLGLVYHRNRQYEKADDCYRRALAIMEQSLGREHAELILSLNNLAALEVDRGRYAEAEAHYQRAMAIASANPASPIGSQLNVAVRGYANLLDRLDRDEEARELFRYAEQLEGGERWPKAALVVLIVPIASSVLAAALVLTVLILRRRGA